MMDAGFEAWVERARRADLWAVLDRVAPGHRVKRRGRGAGAQGSGPCPFCGGTDRFSIDGRKQVFNCRKGRGGDVIAMVEYLTGANFLGAVEIITGEAAPKGGGDVVRADPARAARQAKEREAEQLRRDRIAESYRQREIDRAAKIWTEAIAVPGTAAEAYLALRNLSLPPGARLRCHPALKYWQQRGGSTDHEVVHEGPALVARIDDGAHRFIGAHCTYIDLNTPKGKLALVDPDTGEILPAKKVRGSATGGHIHLGGDPSRAGVLYVGEGIETVLAVRDALVEAGRNLHLANSLFWAAISLGNLGGPAERSVPHPSLTRTDSRGRERALRVPGPVPRRGAGAPVLMPPDCATDIMLLADADSDRFATECVLRRATARWHRPGRSTRTAWPLSGEDFASMRVAALA